MQIYRDITTNEEMILLYRDDNIGIFEYITRDTTSIILKKDYIIIKDYQKFIDTKKYRNCIFRWCNDKERISECVHELKNIN